MESQVHFPSMRDPAVFLELVKAVEEMSMLPSWGNAGDVQTLVKGMIRSVYQNNTTKVNQLLLTLGTALDCIRVMVAERRARATNTTSSRNLAAGPVQSLDSLPAPQTNFDTSVTRGHAIQPRQRRLRRFRARQNLKRYQ